MPFCFRLGLGACTGGDETAVALALLRGSLLPPPRNDRGCQCEKDHRALGPRWRAPHDAAAAARVFLARIAHSRSIARAGAASRSTSAAREAAHRLTARASPPQGIRRSEDLQRKLSLALPHHEHRKRSLGLAKRIATPKVVQARRARRRREGARAANAPVKAGGACAGAGHPAQGLRSAPQ